MKKNVCLFEFASAFFILGVMGCGDDSGLLGDAAPAADTAPGPDAGRDAVVGPDAGASMCPLTTETYSNATSTPIVDGGSISSEIVVSGAPSYLWTLRVVTSIEHTFPSDLDVFLIAPTGTRIALTTDNGIGVDNVFNGTTWSDDAETPVTDYEFVNGSVATSLIPESALSAVVGTDPNGTWKLEVIDDDTGETGMLGSWSLEIVATDQVPEVTGSTFSSATNSAIVYNAPVADSIDVSGLGAEVCDVNVTTTVTHTYSEDLDIILTSPGGTRVLLTTDNGSDNDDVFKGSVWDDDASEPVTDYQFSDLTPAAVLTPEGALGALNGEDPNGAWVLEITDDANGDDGELSGWALEIQTCACQ